MNALSASNVAPDRSIGDPLAIARTRPMPAGLILSNSTLCRPL